MENDYAIFHRVDVLRMVNLQFYMDVSCYNTPKWSRGWTHNLIQYVFIERIKRGEELAAEWSFYADRPMRPSRPKKHSARSSVSPHSLVHRRGPERPGQAGKRERTGRPGARAHPRPAPERPLTLLSSGVGGRGFFEAETRQTEKENEPETEHPQPEVSSWGLFREKGALRSTAGERGQEETVRCRETKTDPVRASVASP